MALPPTIRDTFTGEGRRGGAGPPACWSVPREKAQTAELPATASDRTGQKEVSQAESFAKGLAGAPGHGVRDNPPPASSPRTSLVLAPVWHRQLYGVGGAVCRQGCAPCCGMGGRNGLTRGQGGGGLGQKHQGAASGSAPGSPRGLPNTEHESCTLPVGGHCGSTVTPSGAPGHHPSPCLSEPEWGGGEVPGFQHETWGEAREGSGSLCQRGAVWPGAGRQSTHTDTGTGPGPA